ncbi:MAG TPA: MFS transporter, partial [Chthoniobacteraceae bacterium]|nr:MFS transporter [Chthoniobacteraceae bacterium]
MSAADLEFDSPLAQRAARDGWIKWAIAITVALGAILEVVDMSIVNVALPHMQGNLGATLSEIGWVITGYSMANVVIIPLTAWLDDRFGRKSYFIFSLVAFVLASVLCGLATSLPMLIFARVLQGLGGGSMLGKAQSILFQTFSKEEQGAAQAAFGLSVIMGPAIGPTLGGYLTDALN